MRTVLLVLVFSACGYSQEFRATLAGRITDTVGSGVAGAKIEIKNAGNGELFTTTSGDDGNYQVSFLTPGDYIITVEKPGFKKSIREGVRLEVAARGVVDVQLALGEVSQSVTVSAGAAVLET